MSELKENLLQHKRIQTIIEVYQTSYEFIVDDIELYRSHGLPVSCLEKVHPWAYDIDKSDLKHQDDTVDAIKNLLAGNVEAQLFWLTFFRSQLAVPADEFVDALRQLAMLNNIEAYFRRVQRHLERKMIQV